MKVLAFGATGAYARLVVPALRAHGIEVRAAVHDPARAHIPIDNGAQETVTVDLRDQASVDAATAGVSGVFLITPAFAAEATEMALAAVHAAVAAGVPKFVYSGVYHPSLDLVNHASTRPVESALFESPLDFTVLQPAMFMQGLDAVWNAARDSGRLVMPWSMHSRMSYVDYRDVAEVAAAAFVDERFAFGTFELAAPGMLDRIELASLMSEIGGRPVEPADPESAPNGPAGIRAMFDHYDRNGFHGGNSLVLAAALGRPPRTVADYLAELVS